MKVMYLYSSNFIADIAILAAKQKSFYVGQQNVNYPSTVAFAPFQRKPNFEALVCIWHVYPKKHLYERI